MPTKTGFTEKMRRATAAAKKPPLLAEANDVVSIMQHAFSLQQHTLRLYILYNIIPVLTGDGALLH